VALEVSMTGTGTIGNIAPGWSVNESINSVTIGETGAGTGSVSFNAQATDDSLLTINNNVVSNINGLGNVTGVVQSVSQTGLNTTITHGTFLDKFNLDVDVLPVDVGGPYKWFYNLGQSIFGSTTPVTRPDYGYAGTTYRTNPPYPQTVISAPSYSFPFDGNTTDVNNVYSIDDIFTNSTRIWAGSFQGYGYQSSLNTVGWLDIDASTVPRITGMSFAQSWQTSLPTSLRRFNSLYLQFSATVDASTRIFFGNKFGSGPSAPSFSDCIKIDINGATDVISITEMATETSETASIAGLDKTQPIMFTLIFGGNSMTYPFDNLLNMSLKATDHTGASVTTGGGFIQVLYGSWRIVYDSINTSYMGFVNMGSTVSTVPTTYITPDPIEYNFDIDFTNYTEGYVGAYPATSGVAWELMQEIASAENFEIALNEDILVVRDVGLNTLDVDNFSAPPTTNPKSTLSGSQINISYNEAEFLTGIVYDAQQDGNNIISVAAGATTVTSVKWNVSPIVVNSPIRSDTWPIVAGQYYVIDSAGLPLFAGEWEDYGASVTAIIDPDDNSAIQITVKGPTTETTLAGGPYKLAASDSGVEYASLKLSGTGIYVSDYQLGLITAIDTTKYTRTTVNTIINPFIVTEENAYDRGVWASMKASGPVVTVNFTIPSSAINGVGLTPGSLFDYGQSTYRVVACTINNLSVSVEAERHVLVADVDNIWGSQTVADFDAVWGALECQDQIIFPYKVA